MKRLLFILLFISASSLLALTPQQENDFINAITNGKISEIAAQLDKGASVNYAFTVPGFRGHTPVSIAAMETIPVYEIRNNVPQLVKQKPNTINRMEIVRYLVSRGADRTILNMNAKAAIDSGNDIMALFWVDAGATGQDLINAAKAKLEKETQVAKKIVWPNVIAKLEKNTQAPAVAPVPSKQPVPVSVAAQKEKTVKEQLFDAINSGDKKAITKAIFEAGKRVKSGSIKVTDLEIDRAIDLIKQKAAQAKTIHTKSDYNSLVTLFELLRQGKV